MDLRTVLTTDTVNLHLKGTTKEEIIDEMLDILVKAGKVTDKAGAEVTVKDNTMQNLNFCNYNEDRLLKCKLKLKDSYIYESVLLQEGSLLEGDFVDTTKLKKGENEVLAEVYSYNTDGTLMGQTNVIIVLNLIWFYMFFFLLHCKYAIIKKIQEGIKNAAKAVLEILNNGIDNAMNKYN